LTQYFVLGIVRGRKWIPRGALSMGEVNMVGWRIPASLTCLLALVGSVQAQTYLLQEKFKADNHFHVDLHMELKGKLLFQQGGKNESLEQQAKADHDFVERVLNSDDKGLITRAARFYQSAKVAIVAKDNKTERTLPVDRALIVTQRNKEGSLLSWSPTGPMSRVDLNLFDHFDTLSLPGLLPNEKVSVGATWKLTNSAAQGLCYFEGLTSHSLAGKLEAVKDQKATFSISGEARGISSGADVKLRVNATGNFDLTTGRIVSLTWTQQDDREQGPASPAMSAQVTVKLTREEVQPVSELNNLNLAAVLAAANPPADKLILTYHDPKDRYDLRHDRSWMLVARTNEHLVLRLLDRGDFVAQVSISCWPNAGAGKHADVKEFNEAMERTPGWAQEKEVEAREVKDGAPGYWIYRVHSQGTLNGQPTVHYFYLIAGPNGDQAVMAFAMTPSQSAKLDPRDLDLVRSLAFPTATKADAAKPSP
jgi:hypothetical protein